MRKYKLAAYLFFLLSTNVFALIVTPLNAVTDRTTGGVRTLYYYYDEGGGCSGSGKFPNTRSALGATSILEFLITTESSLTTINNGTAPTASSDISIRADGVSNVTSQLALEDFGSGYNLTSGYYVKYGTTDGATIRVGIVLGNLSAPDPVTTGFCNIASVDCQPNAGVSPTVYGIKFGVVASGAGLTSPGDISEQINIVLANCPPATTSGPVYAPSTPSFSIIPGDGKVKLVNSTLAPSDSVVPVTGVIVYAQPSNSVPTINAPIQQEFSSLTGVYTIEGLVNDTRYCFSLGHKNAAGLVSTDTSWSAQLSTPSGGTSVYCATPSQVDGFLNRSTCFVASVAYGDEWNPKLETLRQFRSDVLLKTKVGRQFVSWYYKNGPKAAEWVMQSEFRQALVRALLFPVVEIARGILWLRSL